MCADSTKVQKVVLDYDCFCEYDNLCTGKDIFIFTVALLYWTIARIGLLIHHSKERLSLVQKICPSNEPRFVLS